MDLEPSGLSQGKQEQEEILRREERFRYQPRRCRGSDQGRISGKECNKNNKVGTITCSLDCQNGRIMEDFERREK